MGGEDGQEEEMGGISLIQVASLEELNLTFQLRACSVISRQRAERVHRSCAGQEACLRTSREAFEFLILLPQPLRF